MGDEFEMCGLRFLFSGQKIYSIHMTFLLFLNSLFCSNQNVIWKIKKNLYQ